MARISAKGTDVLTVAHKLVGLAWVVAVIATIGLAAPALSSGHADWSRLAAVGRVASAASVVTLAFALVYALATVWGFLGSRLLLVKWALYLIAVSSSGYAIRATREREAGLLVLLAVVELVGLLGSMGIGVYLERGRHAGRLPRPRS